jgi:hypothetical protein
MWDSKDYLRAKKASRRKRKTGRIAAVHSLRAFEF